jgi:2-iminobutanoate/2-iminopropanoate deaminase
LALSYRTLMLSLAPAVTKGNEAGPKLPKVGYANLVEDTNLCTRRHAKTRAHNMLSTVPKHLSQERCQINSNQPTMQNLKQGGRVALPTRQPVTNTEVATESPNTYSEAEKAERRALGLPPSEPSPPGILRPAALRPSSVRKRAICAPEALNEAAKYGSAFSRGLCLEFPNGITHLLISGTASVGPGGQTLYPGDFRAQCWRTYHNITKLLASEGATWHDVVRTTCYLRDIERDYKEFNRIRSEFFGALGLEPLPASTGIEAHICRSDLLVEIEALAVLYRESAT